jgi:hypothetical protein
MDSSPSHQLRRLVVCKVYTESPAQPSLFPKLLRPSPTKKRPHCSGQQRLLVLTVDHIALLHTSHSDDDAQHSTPSASSPITSSAAGSAEHHLPPKQQTKPEARGTGGEQAYGLTLALSQLSAVDASGCQVTLTYLPASEDTPAALTGPGSRGNGGLRLGMLLDVAEAARERVVRDTSAAAAAQQAAVSAPPARTMRLFTDTPQVRPPGFSSENALPAVAVGGATAACIWAGLRATRGS